VHDRCVTSATRSRAHVVQPGSTPRTVHHDPGVVISEIRHSLHLQSSSGAGARSTFYASKHCATGATIATLETARADPPQLAASGRVPGRCGLSGCPWRRGHLSHHLVVDAVGPCVRPGVTKPALPNSAWECAPCACNRENPGHNGRSPGRRGRRVIPFWRARHGRTLVRLWPFGAECPDRRSQLLKAERLPGPLAAYRRWAEPDSRSALSQV
jgi:hypothetical protein